MSTGPRTLEGKARSALNATKHGGYAHAVLMKGENPKDFNRMLLDLLIEHEPLTVTEHHMVEQIASIMWRLRRFATAETQVWDAYRYYPFDREVEQGDLGTALAHDRSHVQAIAASLNCEEILHRRLFRTIKELERLKDRRKAMACEPAIDVESRVTS